MNAEESKEFYARMIVVQRALGGNDALRVAVQECVDGFFTRYPNLTRTPWAEQIAVVLTFERLTAAPADSQSANAETQKVA